MPDLEDLADQAKDLLGDHADDVKDGIDEAADLIGGAVGDKKTARSVAKEAKGVVDDVADEPNKPRKARRRPKG